MTALKTAPDLSLYRVLERSRELLEQLVRPLPGACILTFYVQAREHELMVRKALTAAVDTTVARQVNAALKRWHRLLWRLLDPPAGDTTDACFAEAVTCEAEIRKSLIAVRGGP